MKLAEQSPESFILVSMLLRRIPIISLAFLMLSALPACGMASPVSPTPTAAAPTATLPPSQTPAPTLTLTPQAPLAVLLASPDSDPALSAALQSLLPPLAEQAGLRFEVRLALSAAELEGVRVVVAIPPEGDLASLVAAAPQTQFLALNVPGAQPAPNLTVVESQSGRPDQLGFLAGYLAAAITDDWRVGVLSEGGTPGGKAASLGYRNGMTFFCGLCLPFYPPYPNTGYPILVDLPAGAGEQDWQAAIESLKSWQVETVFVYPVSDDQLLAELAEAGINFIIAAPPSESWRDHWVASLGAPDLLQAVPDLWAKILVGQGGEQVSLPLGFTGVNPDLLSPGRQHLAEEMLADLLAGFIDTGVDPQTGESR